MPYGHTARVRNAHRYTPFRRAALRRVSSYMRADERRQSTRRHIIRTLRRYAGRARARVAARDRVTIARRGRRRAINRRQGITHGFSSRAIGHR